VAEALVDARVVRGRCLSYGDGITYWPVVDVVKQLDALPEDEQAASTIRSLLGESVVASGTDEIAWAFRKLLEEQAPLIVCFDDIQWAEETFLDLVESTALLSTGAPLLLVCMARPELLDRRPGWPTTLRLEPLPEKEAAQLVGEAVSDEVRERIVRAAGGNPLFVTEMLSLAVGGTDVEVPATLRALLAARLDQLEEPERIVLERGAVEGELFHRGTVQALAPGETEVTPRLAALVRRGLVRPDRPVLPREDAYRFRHLLIRDAAYDALPKATRADLHRRFADWLEERGGGLVELHEILGYHLEQAACYLEELGRPNQEIALAAGDRLAAAGRRAYQRGDFPAAASLMERSLALTRPCRFDVHLEVELADALSAAAPARAVEIVDAATRRAEAEGCDPEAALARTVAAELRIWAGRGSIDEVEELARAALPLLESAKDDVGLVHIWSALGVVANVRSQYADWAEAGEQAMAYVRRTGHPSPNMFGLSVALALGPRPASEALRRFDALMPELVYPGHLLLRGLLLAMLDRIEEAWAVALPAEERTRELGHRYEALWVAEIALLAGDLRAAVDYQKTGCDALQETGNTGPLPAQAARLGRFLVLLGRPDEAEALADTGRRLGSPDDIGDQVGWRQTQALIDSARGRYAEAEQLAREAVEWAARSDSPFLQGDAFRDLGEVLEAAGRRDEAIMAWQEALDRYEQKQIIPLARRVRERLEALQPA
jgi:tetratricopeptide (TPR) repeat protein